MMFETTVTLPSKLISKRQIKNLADEYSADEVLGDVDGNSYTLIFRRENAGDALLALSSAVQAIDDAVFDPR